MPTLHFHIWTGTITDFTNTMYDLAHNRGKTFVLFELQGKTNSFLYFNSGDKNTAKALNNLSKFNAATGLQVKDLTILVEIPSNLIRLVHSQEQP